MSTDHTANHAGEVSALRLALILYVVIFAAKLVAYFLTGVMVLFAEAMHTLSDIFISGFLLMATIYSRKEADDVHMFGYGRAQNVAALVAATLFISFTAYKLYEESIPRIFNPVESEYSNLTLALVVVIGSMLVAAAPMFKLLVQKQRGAAAKAQLRELFNDQLGLIAALIGTIGIMFDKPLADAIGAAIVATIITISAIDLFKENLSFLLGRSPGTEILTTVENTAMSIPGVLGIKNLRGEYIGPDTFHTSLTILVKRGITIEAADDIAEEVHAKLHTVLGCQYCNIHVDPADNN